jgi:cytochrome c2
MKKFGFYVGAAIIMAVVLWFWMAPPRAWLNWSKRVDLRDPIAAGERLVEQYHCRDCHRIHGEGALVAPGLDDVTQRLDDAELSLWLTNPKAMNAETAMPNFRLSDSEIVALKAYLGTLTSK